MPATVTPGHRERLQAIRERVQTARSARQRAREALDTAREVGDQDAHAVAQIAFDQASDELELAEHLQSQMLSQIAGVGDSFMGSIFDDPQTVEQLQRLGNGSFPIGAIDLGPLSSREELVSTINSGDWGQPTMMAAAGDPVAVPDAGRVGTPYGIRQQPRRPLSILDLIPAQPMDGRSFEYLQEAGSFDGAAETVEGAVKPEGDMSLTDAEVVARVIAVWKKLSRPTLADVPTMQSIVTRRLTYGVLRRLEGQILAGDGVGENLKGILATSGIGDVAFSAAEALTDLALDGIVDTILSDATPDAVAVNPLDWAAMLKAKAAGSGERLDSAGAFSTPAASLWGLPAVPNKAIDQGQALVGDFGNGATLFVREAVNVRLSDSDQDDFTRNRVTALAEGRFGLAVWQPSAFTLVHLA